MFCGVKRVGTPIITVVTPRAFASLHQIFIMRITTLLLAAFLIFGFNANAETQSKTINSEITDVTVFQQGAQVSRRATVQIPAGNSVLLFNRITQNMDPNSIVLGGSGDFTVLSITHRRDFLTDEDKSESMKKLEDEIYKIDRLLEGVAAEEYGLVIERELLEANRKLGGEKGFSLQELKDAADFVKQRREENARAWYILQNQKTEHSQRRQKLQQQINQERQAFAQKTSVVEVRVEASKAVSARFELSYIVNGASWVSSYDVRVDDLTKPVNLTHKAQINQQTGEDWDKVDLTLATGNPSAGAQVPYMGVWYVNFNNVASQGSARDQLMSNANQAFRMKDKSMKEVSFDNQEFQITQNLTQQEYSVDRKQTVASNNSPITVVLRNLDLPAKYEYHVKPRLDKDAFLVAKVYNWAQYDLLDGELSLFNNKTYVGKAYLNTNNPEDTLQLSLGRDKGVVVSRLRVYDKQESTLFGNHRIDNYVWKIELRNKKKVPVDIVLRDQVPVAQNEEIKVTVNNDGGGLLDEKTGIIKWRFTLGPGQSRAYQVAYEVKYPKGKSGGVMYY